MMANLGCHGLRRGWTGGQKRIDCKELKVRWWSAQSVVAVSVMRVSGSCGSIGIGRQEEGGG